MTIILSLCNVGNTQVNNDCLLQEVIEITVVVNNPTKEIVHDPVQVTPPTLLHYTTGAIPLQRNGKYIVKATSGSKVLGETATNFCEFM